MSVTLRVTLGTVNFPDFIHVTASKVSAPTVIAWQDWINTPVSSYNFIIPGLDPENYYIRYYDAATNVALGTLYLEVLVDALTSEFLYERRFYITDGGGATDPVNGDTTITDPYLIGKNVTGLFKEGMRYLQDANEYSFNATTGVVTYTNGTALSAGEMAIVEIKYAAGTVAPAGATGLYSGTLTVIEATKTLIAADRNKRIRCMGTASTQVITLCSLAAVSLDEGFFFDNSCGGTAVQVKILTAGSDNIRFNGFMVASDLFAEFWVDKGCHLLLKKFTDASPVVDFWEVVLDYKGTNVGEKLTAGYKAHPGTLIESGQLIDGDEYPRLWWWIKNVLPNTHYYVTDTVTGSFTPTASKIGQFAVHSTLKKFRMPTTWGMTEKGLANFDTYGADTANRPIDYPGGKQAEMLKSHGHGVNTGGNGTGANPGKSLVRQSYNGDGYTNAGNGIGSSSNGPYIEVVGGPQNRVDNIGVIFARRI